MKICTRSACSEKHYAKGLCKSHHNASWRKANPDRVRANWRKYFSNNREHDRARKRPGYIQIPRVRKDPILIGLAARLRGRINKALRGSYKAGSAVQDLGCTIPELRSYLEIHFRPGMTWDNYGRGAGHWHIDHIKPLKAFDLSDREQLLKAVHYTNLQPLWAEDNVAKGGSYG